MRAYGGVFAGWLNDRVAELFSRPCLPLSAMNSGNLFTAKCVIVGDGAVGKVSS